MTFFKKNDTLAGVYFLSFFIKKRLIKIEYRKIDFFNRDIKSEKILLH